MKRGFYAMLFFHPVLRHIPNALTFLRLFLAPAVAYFLMKDAYGLAFCLFLVAAVTDMLDGALARRWQHASLVGKVADPIADKLLLSLSMAALWYKGDIPPGVFFLSLARDGILLLGGMVLFLQKKPLANPSQLGKMHTFLLVIMTLVTLVNHITPWPWPGVLVIRLLQNAVMATTLASLLGYSLTFLNCGGKHET